ncbi:MAG: gliding motility-associated C-terminal domain-containing protein [Bacteroidia bacterium]
MNKLFHTFIFILLAFNSIAQKDSLLKISFISSNFICIKGEAALSIETGYSPFTINWSNGVSNVTKIKDLEEGDYSVNVIDSIGNDTTISFKIIKEECPISISNHFTPNGDGYNDTWQIGNWQYYPEFRVYVYNKWGQKVHFQENNYVPWDGQNQGVKVADGTYYYVFYFYKDDDSKFLKGDVSILR